VYQAVPPELAEQRGPARVVLVVDVPAGLDVTARVTRLVDDFGRAVAQLIPGVTAHRPVLTQSSDGHPARHAIGPPPTGLTIDLPNRKIRVDGRVVKLAHREFALFAYLAARPHHTVSRATLLQRVWTNHPMRESMSGRTVDTHIRRIRAKLGDHARVLTTVRGQGYRFDPGSDTNLRAL
jgi:hypothetical protein